LAWVDGLLATARLDAAALSRAREELRQTQAPAFGRLDSSLAAFARELAGDRRRARELLMALEQDRVHVSNDHPYLTGVNRITASHWLFAAADTVRAARLLTWHEAIGSRSPHAAHAHSLLAPFAYLAPPSHAGPPAETLSITVHRHAGRWLTSGRRRRTFLARC
jgi:hypothetical protein